MREQNERILEAEIGDTVTVKVIGDNGAELREMDVVDADDFSIAVHGAVRKWWFRRSNGDAYVGSAKIIA